MKAITHYELIRTVNERVPPYVSFLLMMKLDMTENAFFYFVAFFVRFNSLLILCGNCYFSLSEVDEIKALTKYLRYFTLNSIKGFLRKSSLIYPIVCFSIFGLFLIRMLLYYLTINKIKNKKNLETLKINKYQIFMDHVVFLFYPYILEYLSSIYLKFIFPEYFHLPNKIIVENLILLFTNTILLIGYNINDYFFLHVINRPLCARNVPVKYRYSKQKFWIIFLLQNCAMIQNLDFYLTTDNQVKYYAVAVLVVFCLIFFLFFITSLSNFNYDVATNHFLSIMASFCFFSLVSEAAVRIFGYKITTDYTMIMFNFIKIIISSIFIIINNRLSDSKLLNLAKEELFKINKIKIDNIEIYNIYLYIYQSLQIIKNHKENIASIKLINTIFEHQNKCTSKTCKCKLIQVMPDGEKYNKDFTNNFILRISFFIESAFIEIDYSSDYDLTLMLSEHFCNFKNNPIMAYSLLQTLIQYNIQNLTMSQLIIIYETMQKYISIATQMNIFISEKNGDANHLLKERLFKETFIAYEKMYNLESLMVDYCIREIEVCKYKGAFEDSVKIKKNEETGEVYSIDINFLNTENIDLILSLLEKETDLNKTIYENIIGIRSSKLPIEFYYKCFLFFQTFLEGKLDEKIIPVLYSFTNDRNLYSSRINPNIYILLKQRYIDLNNKNTAIYYCIFSYSKGLIINFYSETLAYKLGYSQEELINSNINILMPKQIAYLHDYAVLHYLISKQNRVFNFKNYMFNRNGLMVESTINGSSLPGLGKNLLIIMGAKIIQSEDLRIYFNQNFELISLSESFYKKFYIDLELIDKFNINIFPIFGLDPKKIKEKLINFRQKINKFKFDLNISTDEFFMKKLFKQSHKIKYLLIKELENQYKEDTKGSKNDEIMEEIKECIENIYNDKLEDKLIPQNFQYKIKQSEIINNFNKVINEKSYNEFNDKGYKKIADFFTNMQNILLNENEISNKIYYKVCVNIKLLYDEPILCMKMKEIDNNITNELVIPQNNFNQIKAAKISGKLNKSDVDLQSFNRNSNQPSLFLNNTISNYSANKNNIKVIHRQNRDNNNENQLLVCTRNIIYILISSLILLYIIILIYQLTMIKNSYDLFLAYFYNYVQKNNVINIFSLLLLNYYKETNLFNLEIFESVINEEDFKKYIINAGKKYDSSFHLFYQNYLDYHLNLGEPMDLIYLPANLTKISVKWYEKDEKNIFLVSSQYVVESVISFGQEKIDKNNLKEDLLTFFNSEYQKEENKNKPIYSKFISIFYFVCKNLLQGFESFVELIAKEIVDSFNNYVKKSKIIYIGLETLCLVINCAFATTLFYFLIFMNKIIFRNIVELFIDYTQEESYSFKNNHDNFLFIQKMNELKILFFNFNLKNLDQYNKKISDNTIELLEAKEGKFNKTSDKMLNQDIITKNVINDKKIIDSRNKIDKKNGKKYSSFKNSNDNLNNNFNKSDLSSSINNSVSKTNDKLFNSFNRNNINLISKLNQKITPNSSSKSLNTNNSNNTNTRNSLIGDNPLSNNQNINKDNEGNYILTAWNISDKVVIQKVSTIKNNTILISSIIISLAIYFIIKIILTTKFINNITTIFNDYGILTTKFIMVQDYFNTLCVLLINGKLADKSIFKTMLLKTEEQDVKVNEMKNERLSNYPSVFKMITILNSKQNDTKNNDEKLEDVLCIDNSPCLSILANKDNNMILNGVNLALKYIVQGIDQFYGDYNKIDEKLLSNINNIKIYFINNQFMRISLNLNFILSLVIERINSVFLDDINKIKISYKNIIITSNIIVIAFETGGFIFIIFMTKKTFSMKKFIENSINRLNKVFSYIKEVNRGYQFRTVTTAM